MFAFSGDSLTQVRLSDDAAVWAAPSRSITQTVATTRAVAFYANASGRGRVFEGEITTGPGDGSLVGDAANALAHSTLTFVCPLRTY